MGSERVEPLPTVTVNADGQERRCDYAAAIRVPDDARDRWLVLLVENQSTSDPRMLDRLIGYNRGLRDILAAQSRYHAADGRTPPIIAVVFFTGDRKWRGAVQTRDQSYLPAPELAHLALSFGSLLVETRLHSAYDEDAPGVFRAVAIIRHAPREIAVETCLRVTRRLWDEGGRGRQVALVLKRWLAVVARKRWPNWDETPALEAAAGEWTDPRDQTAEANREEMTMSWKSMQRAVDAVRDEGIEQGLARGRVQGIEQGLAQGRVQGIEQGLEQGREQGIEQGVARGLEMGRREGALDALRKVVAWKFGLEVWTVVAARLGSEPETGLAQEAMNWALESDSPESFLRRIQARLPG